MEDTGREQEKRELRRKRRKRNQIVAYITVILMIVLLAAGIVAGVKYLTAEQDAKETEQQNRVEELLATEEELPSPEPEQLVEATEESVETMEGSDEVLPVEEKTPEQELDEMLDTLIASMSLEDKVAGLFIVTPEAITGVSTAVKAGEGTQKALTDHAVGGIIYFSQNIRSEEQLREMITNSQQYSRYPLFIAVDEEGGSVTRVAEAGIGEKVDNAQAIGATGDANNAYEAAATIGTYLSDLGFNLDFAPVADVANAENSVIGNRAYGSDAKLVASYVSNAVIGLEEQNISACLKHFPGIGSSTEDTHDGLASTDRSVEEFRAEEFVVFQAGIDAGVDMIMVSHMAAPSLAGDNTPSTLSRAVVTDILRNELGFEGVIITDALNMSAISEYHAADEAAIMALRAGCDMLLMPEDFEKAFNGVLQAVHDGTISEERVNDALKRIYRIKYADKLTKETAEASQGSADPTEAQASWESADPTEAQTPQ